METLRCGESVEYDLYARDAAGKLVLYCGQGYCFRESDLETLRRRGIRALLISAENLELYEQQLRRRLQDDPSLAGAARCCAIKETNRSIFLTALQNSDLDKLVQVVSDMATDLADIVCNQEGTMETLFRLLRHDYYTYTHVTNVSIYALALAHRLGMWNPTELAELASGALLHDLGKRHIRPEVLNKKDKLSEREVQEVRKHPLTGFRELAHRQDLTWAQLMMVYQHHERMDGRGYPVGIDGSEIHPWGRICAIADVYDAITSYRAYRRPMSMSDARGYLRRNAGTQFDADMVACWDFMLQKQELAHDHVGP
jgi:HD-GYP domain-containing protein (c-di-GMP phosphodiesterase class II)